MKPLDSIKYGGRKIFCEADHPAACSTHKPAAEPKTEPAPAPAKPPK